MEDLLVLVDMMLLVIVVYILTTVLWQLKIWQAIAPLHLVHVHVSTHMSNMAYYTILVISSFPWLVYVLLLMVHSTTLARDGTTCMSITTIIIM